MAFKDLREFIDKLKEYDEIQPIDNEVDWNLEIGAILRRCYEIEDPAPLFNKVKGYPEGYRVFGGPLGTFKRLAIAMGLKPDAHYNDFLDKYDQGMKQHIKPVVVSDGPCKENIMLGKDVNLYKLPAPMIHDGDGGRYICTWHITITKDPDTGWVNWGMYRRMIHNKNTLGGMILPTQHIGSIFKKYEDMDKPMEFAEAIGTEPITAFVGTSATPYGVNEADVVGGIRGEPVELVKCETVDLMVPATSEIVFEGEVLPNVRVDEGPFGEYTGYRASPRAPRPIMQVKAITHRNDPILTCSCMGMPLDDSDVSMNIGFAWGVRKALDDIGIPYTGVYIIPESCCFFTVVATKTPYSNIAHQIASCIWSTHVGTFLPKIIVVNEDVDPTNLKDVVHALGSKLHPVRGIHVVENAVGWPLAPYASLNERLWGKDSKVLFDCTWPLDWPEEIAIPPKASFNNVYPDRIQKKVLSNWEKYGFKKKKRRQ